MRLRLLRSQGNKDESRGKKIFRRVDLAAQAWQGRARCKLSGMLALACGSSKVGARADFGACRLRRAGLARLDHL